MKRGIFVGMIAGLCCLAAGGCAGVKESCCGVLGVSTKVLEDTRPQAVAKSFAFAEADCAAALEQALQDAGAYIYRRDPVKRLTAVYVSPEDTTPVGIFLEPENTSSTKVLVSSPSSWARDFIAGRVFAGLERKLLEGKSVDVTLERKPGQEP